jgi:hypothetical protein
MAVFLWWGSVLLNDVLHIHFCFIYRDIFLQPKSEKKSLLIYVMSTATWLISRIVLIASNLRWLFYGGPYKYICFINAFIYFILLFQLRRSEILKNQNHAINSLMIKVGIWNFVCVVSNG